MYGVTVHPLKGTIMRTSTRFASVVAGLTLALGTTTIASPADAKPAPCAQEQKQVDRAEDALARVTAVFERQKEKVAKAKAEVRQSETARERQEAKKALSEAKHDRDKAARAKKAQQQRVEKANERLTECQAEQAS